MLKKYKLTLTFSQEIEVDDACHSCESDCKDEATDMFWDGLELNLGLDAASFLSTENGFKLTLRKVV